MNRAIRRTGAGLLLAALLALPAFAAPNGAPEPPQRKTLPNGLRVVVFPRPGSGFVQVQLTAEAGTAAEGPSERGAAPLVARMLATGGTSSRMPSAFATDVDRLGGSFVATANRENAGLGGVFLPEDAETGIELLSDAVINPIFDDAAFEKARTQAVRDLVRLHSDPVGAAEEQIWPVALAEVPGARPPLGDLASLFALTRESLRSFHRNAWRPDHAVLAIAGDLPADRAFALATEWFARWSGKWSVPPAPETPGREGTRIVLIDRPTLPVASVCLGWRVPGRDAADDLARSVGVSLFDEELSAKLAGRLLPEAGLGVSFGQLRGASLLDVRFLTPLDSTVVQIERVRRAVRQVRDAAPDAKRLGSLTRQVRASYPMRFATVGGTLAQWLGADVAGRDADRTLAEYPAKLAALDGAAVSAALARDWNLERTAIVVIGPAAKLRGPLARLGAVTEVTLDEPPAAAATPVEKLAPTTAADEKLGRERIAKAVAAHGGLDKLRGIRDMMSEARIRLILQGHELNGQLRLLRKEPLKMVYLTSFETFESRQVLNGSRAWSMTADGKLQDSDSIGVRALQSGFSSDLPHLLLAASDPGAAVVDRGMQKIGTQELQAVDVTPPGGQRRRLYFEPATSHLVAMDQNEQSATNAHMTARRLYRDLRNVDGVLIPFEEERQLEGQTVMQINVTRVTLNNNLSDDEFTRPASAPAAPPRK